MTDEGNGAVPPDDRAGELSNPAPALLISKGSGVEGHEKRWAFPGMTGRPDDRAANWGTERTAPVPTLRAEAMALSKGTHQRHDR